MPSWLGFTGRWRLSGQPSCSRIFDDSRTKLSQGCSVSAVMRAETASLDYPHRLRRAEPPLRVLRFPSSAYAGPAAGAGRLLAEMAFTTEVPRVLHATGLGAKAASGVGWLARGRRSPRYRGRRLLFRVLIGTQRGLSARCAALFTFCASDPYTADSWRLFQVRRYSATLSASSSHNSACQSSTTTRRSS